MASRSQSYHHGNLRNALVLAAAKMLNNESVDKISLREVARRVGVSQTAPYRHFKDREDLLAAVAREGFGDLIKSMRTGSANNPSGREQHSAIRREFIEFGVKNPNTFRLMFGQELGDRRNYPELIRLAIQTMNIVAGNDVGEIKKTENLPQIEPENLKTVAQLIGFTSIIIDNIYIVRNINENRKSIEDMISSIVEII